MKESCALVLVEKGKSRYLVVWDLENVNFKRGLRYVIQLDSDK